MESRTPDFRDPDSSSQDERTRSLICAYLLGEAEPHEIEEAKALLEASPELREEFTRMEAAVGLVRETMTPADVLGDSLSPEATAGLAAEAARRHGGAVALQASAPPTSVLRPWWSAPPARAAAAVLFVFAGYTVFQVSGNGPRSEGTREYGGSMDGGDRTVASRTRGEIQASGGYEPRAEYGRMGGVTTEGEPSGAREGAVPMDSLRELSGAAVAEGKDSMHLGDASNDASVRRIQQEALHAVGYVDDTLIDETRGLHAGLEAGKTVELGLLSGLGYTAPDGALKSESLLGRRSVLSVEAPGSAPKSVTKYTGAGDTVPPAGTDNFLGVMTTPTGPATPGGPLYFGAHGTTGAVAPGDKGWAGSGGGSGGGAADLALAGQFPQRPVDARGRVAGGGPSGGATAGPGTGGAITVDSAGVPIRLDRAGESSPVDLRQASTGGLASGSDEFFLGQGQNQPASKGADLGEAIHRLSLLERLEDDDGGSPFGTTSDRYAYTQDYDVELADQFGLRGYAELQLDADELCESFYRQCERQAHERPRDMFFRYYGDNPFELSFTDALSTFSVDVDTASYTLARNYLRQGILPEKAQVRTEEFVNYFRPDVAAPQESTFRVTSELAPSLFGPADENAWMLRVALRGREVSREERKPLALTFVVDTSGSMKEESRLELVKHSLRLLLGEMDANDSIAIVAFSREARLILPMTSAGMRGVIESALHPLSPDGGTNADAGLKMGYEVAVAGMTPGAHNRVVFLSDGVANIGETDQDRLNQDVSAHRDRGIYLNTVGVGMDNHNDVFLEQLANKGDGKCDYIDTPDEAHRALVENFTGAFEPIARDVKLQVAFDPKHVERYRLLGYENRAIADADFRNDAVDAGEVGAGHQVVAMYEIVPTAEGLSRDASLCRVHVRYKQPYGDNGKVAGDDEATEITQDVTMESSVSDYTGASVGYRRSVLVAQFAEFLRRSRHAMDDSLDTLVAEAKKLDQEVKQPEIMEFAALVQTSHVLIQKNLEAYSDLARCLDAYREHIYMRELIAELQDEQTQETLDLLEEQNQALRKQVRNLIQARIDGR